jgi:O-phospho-L-seryl-tRNASec:L-selenocysteinyl-tRNA synthase
VSRKTWNLAHGVGRSGDLREPQPKAAGSSILVALTNSLVVDWLVFDGIRSVKEAFVAPVSTGMAMVLCLLALRHKRPHAKYVVWSRIDQKSCFKAIITAGYIPIIVDLQSELKASSRIPYANGDAIILPSDEKETSLMNPRP